MEELTVCLILIKMGFSFYSSGYFRGKKAFGISLMLLIQIIDSIFKIKLYVKVLLNWM